MQSLKSGVEDVNYMPRLGKQTWIPAGEIEDVQVHLELQLTPIPTWIVWIISEANWRYLMNQHIRHCHPDWVEAWEYYLQSTPDNP